MIGASGALLDLVAFWLLHEGCGVPPQGANALGTTLGIANNFAWNTTLTFRQRDHLLRRFCRFYLVGLSGIALTCALLAVFSGLLSMNPTFVKASSLPIVLVLQFILNRKWSFS
ncbi:GtrA family protein [Streptomyces himalayensis]|uniref:GtrA family protein n=1 Tax=Streptomyces himalayensis TaxID=2820085 RepID=UPI0028B0E46D|nr:GtrA family protein [Streptomyces himalayensis]